MADYISKHASGEVVDDLLDKAGTAVQPTDVPGLAVRSAQEIVPIDITGQNIDGNDLVSANRTLWLMKDTTGNVINQPPDIPATSNS